MANDGEIKRGGHPRRLWHNQQHIADDDAGLRLAEIARKMESATAPVELVGVQFSKRHNEEASEQAREEMKWAIPAPPTL